MKYREMVVTKEMINESRFQGYGVNGIKKGYCDLHPSCEVCNKKVRFWCNVISHIEDLQVKIIKKLVKWGGKE